MWTKFSRACAPEDTGSQHSSDVVPSGLGGWLTFTTTHPVMIFFLIVGLKGIPKDEVKKQCKPKVISLPIK